MGGDDRHRRSRRARRSARRQRHLERGRRDRGDLPRQRLPAVPACFVTPHAPARRRGRHRHRQPPPAVRGRRGAPELVRRGDSRLPAPRARRGASARGRRDAVFRAVGRATTASTSSCATASGCSTRGVVQDAEGELQRAAVARRRITRARSSATSPWRARMRGRSGEERLRIGPDWFGDIVDDGLALLTALDGLEAIDGAGRRRRRKEPASDGNEDALAIAAARRRGARSPAFLLAAADPRYVYFLETRGRGVFLRAAPIDVSAHRPRAAARSHARDRADVGDARRRRLVRLRAAAARHRRRRPSCACRRNSTSRSRACCTCRAACRRRSRRTSPTPSRAQVAEILQRTAGPRLRALHQLRDDARASTRR